MVAATRLRKVRAPQGRMLTASEGDLKESATENKPPHFCGKDETVR